MEDTHTISRLMTELRHGLEATYGDRLEGVYLYGSRARQDHDVDSDVDVLIVLDSVLSYGDEIERTSELVSNLSLEYRLSISRVFASQRDWLHGESSFLANVREEALPA